MATQLRTHTAGEAVRRPEIDPGIPASRADTPYTERARYFDSGNAFALKYPPVPCHQFLAERDRALDPASPTGLIPLDLSAPLGLEFPATTPLIMTYYARARAGEQLATRFKASGELYYVIAGQGETRSGDAVIAWGPGDVFCLPGGADSSHRAGDEDCVLWAITNEPQLAFEHLEPPAPGNAVTEAVHYPAAEIRSQLARVADKLKGQKIAGLALVFSSISQERRRNVLPSLTLAVNQLPPGEVQRPHRHNSVAVTLSIQGKGCYSMIGGRRVDWQEHATMVTPPGEVHSHHNDGSEWMTCLIVQDGGLHYHCRTMDFAFADG
jgi:gentisate 1,2-dioxygenase